MKSTDCQHLPVCDPTLPTVSAASVTVVARLVAVVATVVAGEAVAVAESPQAHAVDAGLVDHARPPPGHGVRPELRAEEGVSKKST